MLVKESGSTNTENSVQLIDDYYQFSRKLVANSVTGGTGAIGDRTSGALILLAFGQFLGSGSGALTPSTLGISYRYYFNDV